MVQYTCPKGTEKEVMTMARPDECYNCCYLIQHIKTIPVLRKDGQHEKAAWFDCSILKMPLPTISMYNAHCPYYQQGSVQVKNED